MFCVAVWSLLFVADVLLRPAELLVVFLPEELAFLFLFFLLWWCPCFPCFAMAGAALASVPTPAKDRAAARKLAPSLVFSLDISASFSPCYR